MADFDIARTRKTLFGALLDARDRFGRNKVALEDLERQPITFGWALTDSVAFVDGMKDHGAAGPVDLITAGGAGCGRFTVRPSGTGAPGVKQGGQAGLVRWAESPC